MMNPMQQQQMGGMGAAPELSEEELRKLALLLQQMPQGEGLASINQDEAQLMKDYGGSGTPLPGTQGLGPEGGPVRSYDSDTYGTATSTGAGSTMGEGGTGGTVTYNPDPGTIETSSSGTTGTEGSFQNIITSGPAASEQQPGENAEDYHRRMTNADYDPNDPSTWRAGDSGGTAQPPPPPPKYYDMNGKEWNTQAEADASNAAIKAAMAGIEGQTLTSDSTYARWAARNKDNEAYSGLTTEQMETAYNTALTKSQEDAAAQVPKMVEGMNNFFAETDAEGNKLYGENTTFEEFKAAMGAEMPANLSEATLRDMYANAVTKFQRGEAFTLTPEEVKEFERKAIETATVDDAEKVEIGEVADATITEVGDVADVDATTIEAIASVTDADMDAIFSGGIDEAEALLLARVEGTADSPAERQLMRSSEQNLRMMLGATAGGDADPAKVRQLKNIWADQTQFVIGEAADLRSQESLAAEAQLVELYKGKSTMKLNTKLANMEKEKQTAFKNGDLALAGKLANQQTLLQRVITKASLDVNTKLANLEKAKTLAVEQGKNDLATSIANLQKNLTIATVDTKLAVTQRSMDDAVAIANFKGQQALYDLEAQIDTETMKTELTEMGFDLSRDLAELDSATQIRVAELTKQWREAQGDDQKQAAIYGMIGTALGAWARTGSDINMKTNISPGSGEVESFLDALNSYKYEYKDENAPGADAGMFVGVMAQDLEKTPMGASFVKDTPRGKMVDYGHGLAAILASQANIHDRLRNLEEG